MFKINCVYLNKKPKTNTPAENNLKFINFLRSNFGQLTIIESVEGLGTLDKVKNRLLLLNQEVYFPPTAANTLNALEEIEKIALKNANNIYIILVNNNSNNNVQSELNDKNLHFEEINNEKIIGLIDSSSDDTSLHTIFSLFINIVKSLNNYSKLKEKEKAYLAESEKLVDVNVNNAMLLAEVEKKNKIIDLAKQDIQNLLDNLDEGFILIDKGGIILPHWSRAVKQFFNCENPEGKNFFELLELDKSRVSENISWLESIFSEQLDFNDLKGLGPKVYLNKKTNSHIELDYCPIRDKDKKIEKIIVIAVDRTQEQELKKQIKKEEAWTKAILSMLSDRNSLKDFIRQTSMQIKTLDELMLAKDFDKEHFFRLAHSIKGNSGFAYLTDIFECAKDLENKLQEIPPGISAVNKNDDKFIALSNQLQCLKDTFQNTIEKIRSIDDEILSEKELKTFELGFLKKIHTMLSETLGGSHTLTEKFYNLFVLDNFRILFTPFEKLVVGLSEKFSKIIVYKVLDFELPVALDYYRPFVNSLVHIIRNSVDHGIETPEERVCALKAEEGTIWVQAVESDGHILLTIEDDGGGINPKTIGEKLLQKNIISPEKLDTLKAEEIIQYIFYPSFSTKNIVSDISGRGVGLDAVKFETEKMGGTVKVESTLRKGTKFIFTLPLFRK